MTRWNKSLSVGHKHIDEHHKELFELTRRLDEAISTCRRSSLEGVIIFLEDYVTDHFSEEEDLMISEDFKFYDVHKEEHETFKKWVRSIRISFNNEKSSTHITFELRRLVDDLMRHIRSIDVLLSDLKKDKK